MRITNEDRLRQGTGLGGLVARPWVVWTKSRVYQDDTPIASTHETRAEARVVARRWRTGSIATRIERYHLGA